MKTALSFCLALLVFFMPSFSRDITESSAAISEVSLRGSMELVDQMTGTFAQYLGLDGNPTSSGLRRAFLIKSILSALKPTATWQTDPVTRLAKPLSTQDPNKRATITTLGNPDLVAAYGEGTADISIGKLQELSKTAELFTVLPPAFLHELQGLSEPSLPHPLTEQEQRPLKQLLSDNNLWDQWRARWKELGFTSLSEFEHIASLSMLMLATKVCHAQDVVFLVDQHLDGTAARNKMATGNLDNRTPVTLLSAVGVNFSYGGVKASELLDSGEAERLIEGMWITILESARRKGCRYVTMPAIGMGVFLGSDRKAEIVDLYFNTLIRLMKTTYRNDFDAVYYNPTPSYFEQFEALLNSENSKGTLPLYMTTKDVKFLAINLSKLGHRTAFLNPSDADITWGVYDVGEYYKGQKRSYVGEEDIGSTSTGPIGSKGITPDAYNRITGVQQ